MTQPSFTAKPLHDVRPAMADGQKMPAGPAEALGNEKFRSNGAWGEQTAIDEFTQRSSGIVREHFDKEAYMAESFLRFNPEAKMLHDEMELIKERVRSGNFNLDTVCLFFLFILFLIQCFF